MTLDARPAQPSTAGGEGDPRRIVTREPFNCESALDRQVGAITPTALHFVRSSHPVPEIDVAAWRLTVGGDAAARAVELTFDALMALPARSQVCWLECAGNGRAFFESVQDQPVDEAQLPWGPFAVGQAEWTGVSLSDVLDLAGVTDRAVEVHIEGLDEGKRGRPIPLDVARRPTTLLAYAMNGAPLSGDHGYPLRAIVPGWIGMNSVKWVGRIVVSSTPVKVSTNTTTYVLDGPDHPGTPAITTVPIKSLVALPWEARLPARPTTVRGFAWSPDAPIARVDVSVDGGATWRAARLGEPLGPLAWTPWEFPWSPAPGRHAIRARATDAAGNAQPDVAPWNRLGYLFNAVVAHPVVVG
jgi:sulfane dehydrogenase subunit SoxC